MTSSKFCVRKVLTAISAHQKGARSCVLASEKQWDPSPEGAAPRRTHAHVHPHTPGQVRNLAPDVGSRNFASHAPQRSSCRTITSLSISSTASGLRGALATCFVGRSCSTRESDGGAPSDRHNRHKSGANSSPVGPGRSIPALKRAPFLPCWGDLSCDTVALEGTHVGPSGQFV